MPKTTPLHEALESTRRHFIGRAALSVAGLAVAAPACVPGPAGDDEESAGSGGPPPGDGTGPDSCDITPANIEGPFWREDAPLRHELNVLDDVGTVLHLSGRVFGPDCDEPLVGALVDIWHCGPHGDYDNETWEFEFRGQVSTDEDGHWWCETLFPGRYLNGAEFRPAHVHFKVSADGHTPLTTQLYFEGDEFLEDDPWALPSLTTRPEEQGDGSLEVQFDFVLEES